MRVFFGLLLVFFALSAQAEQVTVLRVLDGDTVVIDYQCSPLLPGESLSIRLAGIDTPESHTNLAKCETELVAGVMAGDFLKNALPVGTPVLLEVIGPDKYSCRMVGRLSFGGIDISQMMIDAGFARPYDGGAKSSWCE